MPWVRLDENFADHPKVERVGPLAAWLHVAALCYCSRHLTDGRIPKAKAVRLTDIPDPAEHVAALLSEGMWVEDDTSYLIHDYLDYQPSRETVLSERAAARDRMAKRRKRSPEVPANNGAGSGEVPLPRPDPIAISGSRPLVTHDGGAEPEDDEDLSTGVPDAVWDAYAELRLRAEPAGTVRSPVPWKRRCAQNARLELGAQAERWWHDFEMTPRRLAEFLIDGQIRNVPRRSA